MRRLLLLAALVACNHQALPSDRDGSAGDLTVQLSCVGSQPLCAHGCGSDWIAQPDCLSGSWVCPADTIDSRQCPPGTCWGAPTLGEVCGPTGWECRPEPAAYSSCPSLMCPECTAFTGPVDQAGCHCECLSGSVVCARRDGGA